MIALLDSVLTRVMASFVKIALRAVGSIVLVGISLGAFALLYSTLEGHITWYFRVHGQVLVNGRQTSGYMHANTDRTILLITRSDGERNETYLIPVADHAAILGCGNWSPIHFVPTPIKGATPPCSVSPDPANNPDPPNSSTLFREGRFVSFSTASGKKVKAEW